MIRQRLFTGWHFMRWIRLGFGLLLTIQTIQTHDMLSGFVAAFFLLQALTNTGCCGVNGCALPGDGKRNTTGRESVLKEEGINPDSE
ncbi:MAG TPA: hypothetical protein VL651_01810 [Bacteroidia bacterium]|jgi:hypothetical protein|nr:hypothetical protein [Bacteroidia bacterium]